MAPAAVRQMFFPSRALLGAMTFLAACCGPSEAARGQERARPNSVRVLAADQASLRRAAQSESTGANPYMLLRPVQGATPYPPGTTIDLDANAITVSSVPARIFLEARLGGWGSSGDGEMRTYQVQLDSGTFASGSGGPMTHAMQACEINGDCVAAFGPAFSGTYCQAKQGTCENAVQDNARSDWCLPSNLVQIATCDNVSTDRRCGSTTLSGQGIPAGPECYMGLFVLDLPASAVGTYTIGLLADGCFIEDETTPPPAFSMATLVPAIIETMSCPRIIASDPLDCAIDARQPHPPTTTSVLQGYDRLRLSFDAGEVAGMIPADFAVSQTGSGTPPSITDVAVLGDLEVEVRFSRVISLRQFTCVAFNPCEPETNKVCVGFLPGDVDQNRVADEADLAYLVTHLDSLHPWQSDIGRSNATTAADIIDWIDVHTGGGAFTPWRNLTIVTACPP